MRPCRFSVIIVASLFLQLPAPAAEPVEDLREALRLPVQDSKNADELGFRKLTVTKRAKALQLADLPGALRLLEWKDTDKDEAVAAVDLAIRNSLIDRLRVEITQVLTRGSTDSKLAAVTAIAEMGITLRGQTDRETLARDYTRELIRLVEADAGPVRQAAARALGKIHPYPKPASIALGKLLASKEVQDRRAAADGLAGILRILVPLVTGRASGAPLEVTTEIVRETILDCLAEAARGLPDDDGAVRRRCLEVLQLAAEILGHLVPGPLQPENFPPPGRKRTAQEEMLVKEGLRLLEIGLNGMLAIAIVLDEQVPAVAGSLTNKDPEIVVSACAVLESLAEDRLRLLQSWDSAVRLFGAKPIKEPFPGLLLSTPRLKGLLKHKEVKVRLAALYVLETLETAAEPVAPALFDAAGDADPFVRWGVARALGKLAPLQPKVAVPGLAKLIDDPNGDVRITALAGLERYGPAAKAAVPRLQNFVNKGDVETRFWVIQALAAVGKDARPAVPALATALADKEVKLRLAAARALRRIGPTEAAADALRQALDDPDADVRRAASAALLAK